MKALSRAYLQISSSGNIPSNLPPLLVVWFLVENRISQLDPCHLSMATTKDDLRTQINYLRSLPAIRQRCSAVHALAHQEKLQYFIYHPEKEAGVVQYCVKIMRRDYPDFSKVNDLLHIIYTRSDPLVP